MFWKQKSTTPCLLQKAIFLHMFAHFFSDKNKDASTICLLLLQLGDKGEGSVPSAVLLATRLLFSIRKVNATPILSAEKNP